LLQNVAERYRAYKGLSFTLQYRYAAAAKPSVWLDSLKGDFAIAGDQYRYNLDSTEFISGKEISVILFKEDQLMYLTRGTSKLQQGNPMALLDSLVLKNDSVDCRVTEAKDVQTIVISFHPVRATKQVEYTIDKRTGYITKMVSIVSARELYDPSVQEKVDNDNTYAIVEADFTGHKVMDMKRDWDLSRLFKKEGKDIIPLAPYDNYKIVIGSPDLQ